MPFDPNKPATLGPLSSAEIRENFRALKEDRIVDAGWLSGFPLTAFVLKSTPTVITAVHTFNPTTAGAPFILGSNAQGQLVTGLNADTVDGQHASAFASSSHNHDTTYVRKGTADTITAVHTFNPSSAGAPFSLGTNAQGQLVTGLNADTVDGQHGDAFVRKSNADTITAVHTFNPSSAGAPFILGANAQSRLVTGLNADTVDGQHGDAFVRKSNADTITAVHTFNPSSAGAPFILGSNAQGRLVTGLNADTVDGMHASEIARNTVIDLSSATEDYSLLPFSTAVINFSNKTSVPLYIATTNNSYYELHIIPTRQNGRSESDVYLKPNNSYYESEFHGSYAHLRMAAVYEGGPPIPQLNPYSFSGSAFFIGFGVPFSVVWIINRQEFRKILTYAAAYNAPGAFYPSIHIINCEWRNTTTPWTSLGTITFPQSTSGTIIIRRLI